MGVERVIQFPTGGIPPWSDIAARLAEVEADPSVRMIDGLPALPDEAPPADWSEVRVSLSGGMVTLRRRGNEVRCVVWGDANPELRRSWDRCAWAVAASGGGVVVHPGGEAMPADRFRETLRDEAR